MVGFSSSAYNIFDFNAYTSTAQAVAAIKSARKVDGGTNTSGGLLKVRDSLFQPAAGMRFVLYLLNYLDYGNLKVTNIYISLWYIEVFDKILEQECLISCLLLLMEQVITNSKQSTVPNRYMPEE